MTFGLVLAILFRVIVTGTDIISHQWDFILAPSMIYCILRILDNEVAKKILIFFGNHSTYIWLSHTFIYLLYVKPLFEKMKFSCIMFVSLLGISLAISTSLMWIHNKADCFIRRKVNVKN